MKIPLIHQQILIQTEKLRDLHRSIMMHSTAIPAADLDRLLVEIRNLYTLALELNNENALQLLDEVQLAMKQSIPEIKEAPVQSQPVSKTDEKVSANEIASTEVSSKPHQNIEMPQPVSNGKKQVHTDIHEMFNGTPTLANRFADHQTLAEKIAGNDGMKRVSDKLKSPVKDIKAAIGLNEKFQFINHLFNGDAKKYNAVIDELNASTSSETAMKYIQEISESNDWESHAAAARSFIDVVERRFS